MPKPNKVGDFMSDAESDLCVQAERQFQHVLTNCQMLTGSNSVGVTAMFRCIGWVLVHAYDTDEEAQAYVEKMMPMLLRDMRAHKDKTRQLNG